ncbi:MAG: hypothetical protein KAW12_08450 [Candidatus Aminicenantes bacterium]|nr:hypothetical protein [Candidatus Aminicenantes bacterium]
METAAPGNASKSRHVKIKELIKENSSLFWYIKEDAKGNISVEVLVENILHYGNEKSVKKLFDSVGIEKVAEIFYKQVSGSRINYPPRTVHFFDLYFKKHA